MRSKTYRLIGCVANLLAYELVHPFGRLAAVVGLETWDYERHDFECCEVGFDLIKV